MDKIQRYKKLYPAENGIENLTLIDGHVKIPHWLICLIIHTTGLKSRKKRLVKKRLKREVTKLILTHVKQEGSL